MAGEQLLVAERYRLANHIGSGGMGRVWLARDEVLRRDVAVKEVILPEGLTDAERDDLCERTLREARAAGRLNHPNAVQIYDVVQFEGRPWIVMELVRSRSLYQVIREDGPVSPKRAAEIGLALLGALRAAHAAGVWHRDVKPGNVLLADDGRVVLTDFGLATYDGDGAVTRAGLILGSAQYISPERARDGVSGPQSDMWSLGATLYAAVEGRSPYARESSMATLTALATAPPDPPRRAGPLRGVLIGLLRKNPRQRLTIGQAEKELKRVISGDARGRGRLLIPRSRVEPRADALAGVAASAGAGPAGAVGTAPAPPGANQWPRRRSHLQTATEETYRVPARNRRRWPWLVAGLAVLVTIAAAALALDRSGSGTTAVTPSASDPAIVVTPAMQVQGCLAQTPAITAAVTGPVSLGPYATFDGWVFQQHPAGRNGGGYHVAVPSGWRTWTVGPDGSMRCFRDPSSLIAAVVIQQGSRAGTPLDLIQRDVPNWLVAAGITGYEQVRVGDLYTRDGGAELEYTYAGDGQDMRGHVYLTRKDNDLFLVSWVSRKALWQSESSFADGFLASFDVDR